MEKEFIPYEQALALKELGFDEPCVAFSYKKSEFGFVADKVYLVDSLEDLTWNFDNLGYYYSRPTFSQAFRWFREKYGYFTSPNESDDDISKKYDWLISKNLGESKIFIQFIGYRDSYEEAELECLKKLIEIVKNK